MITVPQSLRLKNTIKYPTTVIVGGLNKLGIEIADSLMKQGGYVVIVDAVTEKNIEEFDVFEMDDMISFLDYTSIPHLEEDIRRLDYVFYFSHESIDFHNKVSTQEFLTFSNYLDASLSLASKFDARFQLTTSIKANQVYFAENKIDYDLNPKSFHAYTDMEVQRYAEGLTMEYFEKVNLNTRIVRIGELIGEGMDFASNSAFVNLVLQAVKGESLLLENDGLEHEWFVHILDAAYGLIKAQFSKDTSGKTFSLSLDNNYTHLSIAYKIQELENDAKEIQFVDAPSTIPPVKIHKPATNLSTIGWMPRITFDKAVKQSLASAKIFILESGLADLETTIPETKDEKSSLSDKIMGFFSIANKKNPQEQKNTIDTLITKKKSELDERKKRMESADKIIKVKKRTRSLSFGEKTNKRFWNFLYSSSKFVSILRRKSPVEIGALIFLIVTFTYLYFTLLSPGLLLVRNAASISPKLNKVVASLDTQDFGALYEDIQDINNNLDESIELLSRFDGIFSFVSLGSSYDEFINTLEQYNAIGESIEDISYAIEPYNEYLERFENNTQIRSTSESYIAITSESVDYSPILEQIETRKAFLDDGIDQLSTQIDKLNAIDTSYFPGFIKTRIADINENLRTLEPSLNGLRSYGILPELLGVTKPRTYFIGILDNTRPSPLGGDLAAYALLTIQNGAISQISISSADGITINTSDISPSDLEAINKTRFIDIDSGDATFTEFSSIIDIESFQNIASSAIENIAGTSLDGAFMFDLNALNQLATQIGVTTESKIAGVEFGEGDMLENLSRSLGSSASVSTRHDLIAQVTAWVFYESIEQWSESNSLFLSTLVSTAQNQSIRGHINVAGVRDFINEESLNRFNLYNADTFLIPELYVDDPKIISSIVVPNVTIVLDSEIRVDSSVAQEFSMTYPKIGTTQQVGVCIPGDIRLSSIEIITRGNSVPESRVSINDGLGETCIIGQSITEDNITIKWETPKLVTSGVSGGSLKMGIGKLYGVETKLDHSISGSGITLESISNSSAITSNKALYRSDLLTDTVIEIGF